MVTVTIFYSEFSLNDEKMCGFCVAITKNYPIIVESGVVIDNVCSDPHSLGESDSFLSRS